ncbi:MAG: protein translocase SEC61 complex subunit gamma [Thermoproteota archaeon]
MQLKDKLKTVMRVLKLSEKPDGSELMMSLKIFLLGLLVVGGMSFVIHLIATLLQLTGVKLG